MSASDVSSTPPRGLARMRSRRPAAVLVFCSLLLYSAVRAPVPAVNEPHYLAKAKHYWNPQWCAGDFFLQSANAHVVFYETVGRLTQWLSLPQTAWAGRILAFLLLTAGWMALTNRAINSRWGGVWTLWTFLALAATGNLSGEWIAGGVESKIFAYGFVFLGIAFAMKFRWKRAGICTGLAVSFHPVVGVWSLAAGLLAAYRHEKNAGRDSIQLNPLLKGLFGPAVVRALRQTDPVEQRRRYSLRGRLWKQWLAGLALAAVFALPGLLPALKMLGGTTPLEAWQADFIQVYYRLNHHLDPKAFSIWAYLGYTFLFFAWLFFDFGTAYRPAIRFFRWFVFATVLIALGGLIVGLFPKPQEPMQYALPMRLLKFYPFRLVDVFLPLGFAVGAVYILQYAFWGTRLTGIATNGRHGGNTESFGWVIFGVLFLYALFRPGADRDPSRMTAPERADWQNVCGWIDEHVPADAVFYTPRESWAFKWYAQRAEYVNYKDVPQDAAGIIEWNRRLRYLRDWSRKHHPGGYSAADLRTLRDRTGITHLLTRRLGPIHLEPVYRNDSFRVYDLRAIPGE